MKMTKKISSLVALMLLAATLSNYGMKRLLEKDIQQKPVFARAQLPNGEMVDIIGLILNQNAPMKLLLENFDFKELPIEVQSHIIQLLSLNTTATTLKEATDTIRSLSSADKELHQMINNPRFCLQLIKNLSNQFKCSDQEAAGALKTPEAQRLLNMQMGFMLAINRGDNDTVIELCQNGIDVNFTKIGSTTHLMSAARLGNSSIIQILLKYGADINKADPERITALMLASDYGHIKAAQCLLNNPAIEINKQTVWGVTALMMAAQNNNCDMIQLLIQYGADINTAKSAGKTALMIATANGHIQAAQCLLRSTTIAINQQNYDGQTALMLAAESNNCHLIQLLIKYGADVNKYDEYDMTALMYGVLQGRTDTVQCLLNSPNLAINQQYEDGSTALLLSLFGTNRAITQLLLAADADPEIANFTGLTPLEKARQTGDQAIINLIQNAIARKYGRQ